MSLYSLSAEANQVETLSTPRAVLANRTSLVYLDCRCFICMSQPCGKSISHLQGPYSTYNITGIRAKRCKQKARYDGSRGLEITSSFRSHLYERRGKDKKNKRVALAPLVSSPPRVMIAHKSRAGLVEQNKTRALKGKMELFHSTGIKADDSGMFLLLWRISSIT